MATYIGSIPEDDPRYRERFKIIGFNNESNYIFWKSYVVTLTINILNQNGEPVFQSKSKGYTNRGFWDYSIDENRIQNALEEAIYVMKEIEMENEISTFSAMSKSTSLVP